MVLVVARVLVFALLAVGFCKTSVAAPSVSTGEFRRTVQAIVGKRTGIKASKAAGRYLEHTLRDRSNKGLVVPYSVLLTMLHRAKPFRFRPAESLLFTQHLLDGYLDGKRLSAVDFKLQKAMSWLLGFVDRSNYTLAYAERAERFVVARLEKRGVSLEQRTIIGRVVFRDLANRFGFNHGGGGEL